MLYAPVPSSDDIYNGHDGNDSDDICRIYNDHGDDHSDDICHIYIDHDDNGSDDICRIYNDHDDYHSDDNDYCKIKRRLNLLHSRKSPFY
jgi:hypothetical protein